MYMYEDDDENDDMGSQQIISKKTESLMNLNSDFNY